MNEKVQRGNGNKERIHTIDRKYLRVGSSDGERQKRMSAREQEEDGKTHALEEKGGRERWEGKVYTYVRSRRREEQRVREREGCRVAPFGGRSLLWG